MWHLRGAVQAYGWGSSRTIPEFLGIEPDGSPCAEVWFGGHPGAPSTLLPVSPGPAGGDTGPGRLDELVADGAVLGDRVRETFGERLPFLVKLLAADRPLSLQVHPDARRARDGYAREQAAQVPVGLRSYVDDQHKPETLVALTGMRALAGFREPAAVAADLVRSATAPLLTAAAVLDRPGTPSARVAAAFEHVLRLPAAERRRALDALAERPVGDRPWGADPLETARALAVAHPDDAGALASVLLNPVDLPAGHALSVGAGVVHCYVGGFGLEIMASSDNVLRAGLTTKRVDLPELLAAVDFTPHAADVRAPSVTWPVPGVGVQRYDLPFAEFGLRVVDLVDPRARYLPGDPTGPRVVLGLAGTVVVSAPTGRCAVAPGEAVLVGDGEEIALDGSGRVALVAVP
ncbi:MAG TPA: mannose-6-phosphate isomerase, class I [Cellulomonas sp.]